MLQKKIRRVLGCLLGLVALFGHISCADIGEGVLAAIEDAKDISDGTLSNYLFAHSLISIDKTVYLGSKFIWQKTSGAAKWSKIGLPSGLDPNDNPIVSIATDGSKLFLTSNKKIYVRDRSKKWFTTSGYSSVGFSYDALRGVAGNVLAVDKGNTIYQYKANSWQELKENTKMNDFAKMNDIFYLASGTKIFTGNDLSNLTEMKNTLNDGSAQITNLLAVTTTKNEEYLFMLASGKLYFYKDKQWKEASSSAKNISLAQVKDQLIVGRKEASYHIYDIKNEEWKSNFKSDGFTDGGSFFTLASGVSFRNLNFGIFLFYDDNEDSKDRIYAATSGSKGVLSAKRKNDRWSWEVE